MKRDLIDKSSSESKGAFTRSDLVLNCRDWCNLVVGKISTLNVDNDNHVARVLNQKMLVEELSWAGYLGITAVMINIPDVGPLDNFARIINSKMKLDHSTPSSFWVRVPMVSRDCVAAQYRNCKQPPEKHKLEQVEPSETIM